MDWAATRASWVALALVIAIARQGWAQSPEPEFEPGDVIVHWKPGTTRSGLRQIAAGRISRSRQLSANSSLLRLEHHTLDATRRALRELAQDPRVLAVEPNYIRRIFKVPDDAHYVLQWNIKAAKIEEAWDITTGSSNIVVAVVDTGILAGHPDLKDRLAQGYDFISDSSYAADGDARDTNPNDEGADSTDSSMFHGTHVAGIIGAASNNAMGIAGVSWGCRILPVRALGVQAGRGKDADIAAAIRWAAGVSVEGAPSNPAPAHIINLSFGGPGASKLLSDAIKDAQDRGTIVVAAAGNYTTDAKDIFPAAIPGVITVGATQPDGQLAPYSDFGEVVEIMAPGGNMQQVLPVTYQDKQWLAGVFSTHYAVEGKKYTYRFLEGTSQAAPLVSGVVALMLSLNPKLTAENVTSILQSTADPASKCSQGCGSGLINTAAALAVVKSGSFGTTSGQNDKLPFSYACGSDSECLGGLCRAIAELGNRKVCTVACEPETTCPNGGSCSGQVCVPQEVRTGTYAADNPSAGQAFGGGTVWGGGCSVGPSTGAWRSSTIALFAALFALGWFCRRKRFSRRP